MDQIRFAIKIIIMLYTFEMSIGGRISNTDSILDIINIGKAQRSLERSQNSSRIDKLFLIQNDLEEDFQGQDNNDDYIITPEVSIDFQLNGKRQRNHQIDNLMRYNDTIINYPHQNSDILSDLQSFRADKMLKSSKSALTVTKKEYLKQDWCKTEPLVQRIREEGCFSRTIINRFCYGQCNSFYIPKGPKRRRHKIKINNKNNNNNNNNSNNKKNNNSNNNNKNNNNSSNYSNNNNNNNNNSKNNNFKKIRSSNRDSDFEDEDLTGAAFKSCAFCKPKKITWITVTFRCPSLVPQLRRKRIQRIKQCKCIAEPLN